MPFPAKPHLNGISLACRWWPNIECWLGSFVIVRGSRPVLLRNPIFLWFFRGRGGEGGGVGTPCPPPPLWIRTWQTRPFYVHADLSSRANDLKFGLYLHLHPYVVYVPSYWSGKSMHLQRLTWAFVAKNVVSAVASQKTIVGICSVSVKQQTNNKGSQIYQYMIS